MVRLQPITFQGGFQLSSAFGPGEEGFTIDCGSGSNAGRRPQIPEPLGRFAAVH